MMASTKGRPETALVPSCKCEVVERGPNWLFVKVTMAGDPCGVAERLWEIARSQFVYRIVVEFEREESADAACWAELGLRLGALCDRLTERGGALRLAGLSPEAAHAVIGESGCVRLHNHATARDAVWCGPCCDGQQRFSAPDDTVATGPDDTVWRSPTPK